MKKLLLFCCALLPLLAQAQVASYTFTSTTRPYVPITGTRLGADGIDDDPYIGLPIGFTFTYNGVNYSTVSVNSNGVVALGPTVNDNAIGAYFLSGLIHSGRALSSATAPNNAISGFNMDLTDNAGAGLLSYTTLGTAPSRVLVVQWSNFIEYQVTDADINFQVRILEGSNRIEVAYGSFAIGSANPDFGAQVGLRGASAADVNLRATNTDWSASTAGTANTDSLLFSSTVHPASGLVYAWTPVLASVDLSLNTVTTPPGQGCSLGASAPLTLSIANQGTTAISTVNAGYSVNGGAAVTQTFALPGPLAPGATTTITFSTPATFGPAGAYDVLAYASGQGEAAATSGNDTVRTTLNSLVTVTPTLPYVEGFASTTELPTGWTTDAFGQVSDWQPAGPDIFHGSGTFGTSIPTIIGPGAAFFNSYSSAFTDARLSSPCLNLSGITADSLVLEVSYLQSGAYPDRDEHITLEVSTDAGATYNPLRVLTRYNPDLGIDEGRWALGYLALTPYRGLTTVRLGFRAAGFNGDNQAIDYIRLLTATPVANRPGLGRATVVAFPNPSAGLVSLGGLPAALAGKPAQVLDMSGRAVATLPLAQEMSLGNLPAGLYYLTAPGLHVKLSIAR